MANAVAVRAAVADNTWAGTCSKCCRSDISVPLGARFLGFIQGWNTWPRFGSVTQTLLL